MYTKANNLLLSKLLPVVDQVALQLKANMSVPALHTTHAIKYLKPDLWKLCRTKYLLTSLLTNSSTKVCISSRRINGSFSMRRLGSFVCNRHYSCSAFVDKIYWNSENSTNYGHFIWILMKNFVLKGIYIIFNGRKLVIRSKPIVYSEGIFTRNC